MKSLHFLFIFDPIVDLELLEVIWKWYKRLALGIERTDLGCHTFELMFLTHLNAIY